jgi:hypothetical protein
MTKKCKVLAAVLCLALLFGMVFSAAYLVGETGHRCTGEGCPICREMQVCQQVLHTLGAVAAGAAVSYGVVLSLTLLAAVCLSAARRTTLISLKVKLSD